MTPTTIAPSLDDALEALYSADLQYVPDCWTLCGDAHCCGFSRYKKRFRLLATAPFQALPMLAGEYEFLRRKGWTQQFGEHEHRVTDYAVDDWVLRAEEVVSWRSGCCCDKQSRTVVCRLYPLLPVLSVGGELLGVDDRFGSFEELEALDGMQPACQVRALPFAQMPVFLQMARVIASVPQWNFQLQAYQLARRHVFGRVRDYMARSGRSAFDLFETMYFTRRLFAHEELKQQLRGLADEFRAHYGAPFPPGPAAIAAG